MVMSWAVLSFQPGEESGAWKEGLRELQCRELRDRCCERRCDPPRSRALHQALGPLAP